MSTAPTTPPGSPTKVFISYAHASPEHVRCVLEFANQLRREGVDCRIDQYVEGAPAEGWPLWMERMVAWADYVLVVGSERYLARYELREAPGTGRGATWEGAIIRIDLYEAQGNNYRFLPILFGDIPADAGLPKPLRGQTIYRADAEFERLYRVLTGQPAVVAPEVGAIRSLPPVP